MKTFTCILLVLWSTLTILPAQTAADYYLPLQIGNNLVYQVDDEEPRSVCESIEGTDSISGIMYFRQEAVETMNSAPLEPNVCHVFWLREDSLGNILVGAVSLNQSPELDSAMIYENPGLFFPNEFLTLGYFREYFYSDIYVQDSIMSISETVDTPAGIFTNCIKVRHIYVDSLGTTTWLVYAYYAEGIGEVMKTQEIPVEKAGTSKLIQYHIITSVKEKNTKTIPIDFTLQQNYPNPFNPSTTLSYQLPESAIVNLSIYNVTGQWMETLEDEHKNIGQYSVKWNAENMPSGIYVFRIQAGDFMSAKKCVLMK